MQHTTTAEANARLDRAEHDSLAEWAYESHKDFYGCKGRHMTGWSTDQLRDWIKAHFHWDEDAQAWTNSIAWED